jgi:hypothetical protein
MAPASQTEPDPAGLPRRAILFIQPTTKELIMETTYKNTHNDSFDTALAFLECRAREAGLTDFTLDKAFTYTETQVNDVEGIPVETVLFEHTASGRSIGIEVDKGEAISVWVSDKYGEWIDDGTDADKIRKNPKAWFKKTLLPKKYRATASINYCIDVECEAYDEDEAREKLEEQAYETYQTADVDGVDAVIEAIDEV